MSGGGRSSPASQANRLTCELPCKLNPAQIQNHSNHSIYLSLGPCYDHTERYEGPRLTCLRNNACCQMRPHCLHCHILSTLRSDAGGSGSCCLAHAACQQQQPPGACHPEDWLQQVFQYWSTLQMGLTNECRSGESRLGPARRLWRLHTSTSSAARMHVPCSPAESPHVDRVDLWMWTLMQLRLRAPSGQ